MRLGGFELDELVPDLEAPHALAILHPWVDVGSVGTLTLSWLEAYLKAEELGRLARPGHFFDFTRYRPNIYFSEGMREVTIPNTLVNYSKGEGDNDFLFLHLLEPHMLGEAYVDSVLRLLVKFGVKRYCLVGGMYDMVPHTKPLIVSGGAVGAGVQRDLKRAGVQASDYEGPTTIAFLISQRAPEFGIETASLIVHLPQYAQLDEDYIGKVRLMEVLCSMYDLPMDEADVEQAEQQRIQITSAVSREPELQSIVTQLEAYYEARTEQRNEEEMPQLSPEIEKFLKEIDRRFRQR
jgi:hypothetical protein